MRRAVGILAFAVVLSTAGAAHAATPSSGSVSSSSAETGWTGAVDGTAGPSAYAAAGGTQGLCREPQCDTYTLQVDSPAVRLELRARTHRTADTMSMEIIRPDGTSTYVYDRTDTAQYKIEQPALGTYTLHLIAGSGGGSEEIGYSGRATLVERDPVAPEPAYPVSPEHPRNSPEVGTPGPTAPAVSPLRLRVGADATAPVRVLRGGLRVRVRCSGGCVVVRLRLVSGRRVLGHAVVSRGAEGRAIAVLRILRRFRTSVRRARSLPVTLAAEASASDGRTASDSVSLTLHR